MFIFGGASLKVISLFLSARNGDKDREHKYLTSISDAETQFRKELREDVEHIREKHETLVAELDVVKADLDKWKEKYYEALNLYQKEKVRSQILQREIEMIKRYMLSDNYEPRKDSDSNYEL